jgi:hypothetical protein
VNAGVVLNSGHVPIATDVAGVVVAVAMIEAAKEKGIPQND